MIFIVQCMVTLLIITFFIFSIIVIYSKILKKESKAFFGMMISFILLLGVTKMSHHLIKNELVKNIKHSKIEQKDSAFSKEELSDITVSDERKNTIDKDIYLILLPEKDTIYLNQDARDRNKFWIHYKKYEILKNTASIGYIMKK